MYFRLYLVRVHLFFFFFQMSQKKSTSKGEGEEELEDAFAKLLASHAGVDEEEVTDAQAEAVLAEIFGKGESSGGAAEVGSAPKVMLSSTMKSLEQAGKFIKIAVAYDTNGEMSEALESYEKGIELFSEVLQDPALTETNATRILQSLESYLDRSIHLQLTQPPDFTREGIFSRKLVIERMTCNSHDFNVLKRGVSLYSKFKKEGHDNDYYALVLYSEALECLIIAMKSSSAGAKSPMVLKCVEEMITRLEIVNANHPPNPPDL